MIMFAALMAGAPIVLASPDRSNRIEISADGASFSVSRKGERLVDPSPLGLEFSGAPELRGLRLVGVQREGRNRLIPLTASKAKNAVDHYNGAKITLREAAGLKRTLTIEARAYNDGVAFRYVMPAPSPVALKGEKTAFRLAGDPKCLVTEFSDSHEKPWQNLNVSKLDRAKRYDLLTSCESRSGKSHFALAQSDLSNYAGARLKPEEGSLRVDVIPRLDRPDVAVLSPSGLHSAWRAIMLGNRAGDLIESQLIGNLAPQAKGDFSWVKPGKAAWDWWSGTLAGEKPTMERFKRFIDFAAASGFPYFLIDAGWPLNSTGCCEADPKTDITTPNPAIDMPALVKYAADKGVGLLLWAHWKHVDPRMDEVLDTYKRWGIKGIKVDFTNRDDQQMVQFFTRLAEATAKRQLLLDMHSAFLPAGIARTFPNYITQEGVMGLEYDKFPWGQVTPGHNVHLAFTRMLVGPMDYTPGGFRNSTPATYVPSEVMPMVRTTRGQAIAQYVVYESPLQMVSDDPSAYENAPGFDFIKTVPTAWDETRFVGGTPDSHVVIARRKGASWYLGAMTNEEARTVEVPLAFLGKGAFKATIWLDGSGPNEVRRSERTVRSTDVLTIPMAAGGGAAMSFSR